MCTTLVSPGSTSLSSACCMLLQMRNCQLWNDQGNGLVCGPMYERSSRGNTGRQTINPPFMNQHSCLFVLVYLLEPSHTLTVLTPRHRFPKKMHGEHTRPEKLLFLRDNNRLIAPACLFAKHPTNANRKLKCIASANCHALRC